MIRDINRRDIAYADNNAQDLWRLLLDELPDSFRCRLEDRYHYTQIQAMVADIYKHAHRCPDRSPFSEKNLQREREQKRVIKVGNETKTFVKHTNQLALEAPQLDKTSDTQ